MKSLKVKLSVNKLLIMMISFIYMAIYADLNAQNVAITDDDGYSVNAAAMLDVKSINKGFLVPRVALVSTTDPVSVTKPAGLLVWNTSTSGSYPDQGFYYWSGTNWVKVGSSALDFGNGLTKSGNSVKLGGALTELSTITQGAYSLNFNLSGTGDFDIQDEGTSAFFVKENGNVGIGTTSPGQKLEVNGNLKLGDNIMLEGNADYRVYRNLVSYGALTTTGAVVINTNQPMNSMCMFKVKIEGYLYSSGPLGIIIGAYTNSSGFHYQGHLNVSSEKLQVRLARNTSTNNMAIILGDIATSFSHPKFSVTEFYQGHNGKVESYADGWTITQVTDLAGYDYVEDVPDVTNMDNRYYTETEVDNMISGENLWDRTSTNTYLHNSGDKVGIGLSDPPMKLSVLGNALFTDDIYLRDGSITGDNLVRIYDSSDDGILDIYANNVVRHRLYGNGLSTFGYDVEFRDGGLTNDRLAKIYDSNDDGVLDIYQNDAVKIRLHGNSNSYFTGGNVGFGTTNPGSRVEVYGNESGDDNDPLFEVKNNTGQTIFAVYPEGVRIYVDEEVSKGLKGGFAVGGFNSSKAITNEYLRITPDSVRIYVDNDPGSKGLKGGFAVGGFNSSKGYENAINFMDLTPENYFIGHESGTKTTPAPYESDGKYNSFFGYQSGKENTVGSHNLFMGYQSGYSNIYGTNNVFLGIQAGYENTGIDGDLYKGCYNVFIGYLSGMKNTEGQSNVFIGNLAGINNTLGRYNTFIGRNTAGQNTEGNFNTYIGAQAAESKTGGNNNVFLGNRAGASNGNGSGNVFVGYKSGEDEPGSNLLYIDNSDTPTPLIYGNFATGEEEVIINGSLYYTGGFGHISDIKFKSNIEPLSHVLNKLKLINGVYFDWREDEYPEMVFNKGRQVGVIAQELEKVFPELVQTTSRGYKTVNYMKLTAILIEAVKEQQQVIEELENESIQFKNEIEKINDLQNQIDRLRNSLELNKQ